MEGVGKGYLGVDVVAAIAKAKTCFATGKMKEFDGRELNDPHVGTRGAKFFEFDVGHARPTDLKGERGSRRLVIKAQSNRITEMYFSDSHYKTTGTWRRILDF